MTTDTARLYCPRCQVYFQPDQADRRAPKGWPRCPKCDSRLSTHAEIYDNCGCQPMNRHALRATARALIASGSLGHLRLDDHAVSSSRPGPQLRLVCSLIRHLAHA